MDVHPRVLLQLPRNKRLQLLLLRRLPQGGRRKHRLRRSLNPLPQAHAQNRCRKEEVKPLSVRLQPSSRHGNLVAALALILRRLHGLDRRRAGGSTSMRPIGRMIGIGVIPLGAGRQRTLRRELPWFGRWVYTHGPFSLIKMCGRGGGCTSTVPPHICYAKDPAKF